MTGPILVTGAAGRAAADRLGEFLVRFIGQLP